MLKYLLLVVLLSVSLGATAQRSFRPGYVVTHEGDTLRGEVLYRGEQYNATTCVFRLPAQDSSSRSTYVPAQLRGYGFTGEQQYQSQLLPNADSSLRFVQLLVAGRVSLYRSVDKRGEVTLLARKEVGTPLQLLSQRDSVLKDDALMPQELKRRIRLYDFRQVLWEMMSDCLSTQVTLLQTQLNEVALTRLVYAYNQCVEGAAFVGGRQKAIVGLTLLAGTYQSGMSYAEGPNWLYASSPQLLLGLGIHVRPARFNHRVSMLVQALYARQQYHDTFDKPGKMYFVGSQEIISKISFFQVPLQLRYTLGQGRIRPYGQLGGVLALRLQRDAQVSIELPNGINLGTHSIEVRRLGLGAVGGLGVVIATGPKALLNLEARFDGLNSTSVASGWLGGTRAIALLAGYTFGSR